MVFLNSHRWKQYYIWDKKKEKENEGENEKDIQVNKKKHSSFRR